MVDSWNSWLTYHSVLKWSDFFPCSLPLLWYYPKLIGWKKKSIQKNYCSTIIPGFWVERFPLRCYISEEIIETNKCLHIWFRNGHQWKTCSGILIASHSNRKKKLKLHQFLMVWMSSIYTNKSNLQEYNYPLDHTCQLLLWGWTIVSRIKMLSLRCHSFFKVSNRITAYWVSIKENWWILIKCVFLGEEKKDAIPPAAGKGFILILWNQNLRLREYANMLNYKVSVSNVWVYWHVCFI